MKIVPSALAHQIGSRGARWQNVVTYAERDHGTSVMILCRMHAGSAHLLYAVHVVLCAMVVGIVSNVCHNRRHHRRHHHLQACYVELCFLVGGSYENGFPISTLICKCVPTISNMFPWIQHSFIKAHTLLNSKVTYKKRSLHFATNL